MIFIGELIKKKLVEQNKSVVWLAALLSCSRTNVYKILRKKSIDTDDLLHFSKVLKYDFFEVYSKEAKRLIAEEREKERAKGEGAKGNR